MKVTVWGARGSLPSSVQAKSEYGNNTTCVSIEVEDLLIILDAGSGLFACTNHLLKKYKKVILCLTHVHWDHIMSLPFFQGFFRPDLDLTLASPHAEFGQNLIDYLMNGVNFPVTFKDLTNPPKMIASNFQDLFSSHNIQFDFLKVTHPGDAYAFSFNHESKKVVFCPDHEINSKNRDSEQIKKALSFFDQSDLLIHDCQYDDADYPAKEGWGHSFFSDTLQAISEAAIKQTWLCHHDPFCSDDELKKRDAKAKAFFKNRDMTIDYVKEGQSIQL